MRIRSILAARATAIAALALAACNGTDPTFTVGGNISGINGTTAVLKLNGGNDISMSSDGSFTFSQKLTQSQTFNVQVVVPNLRCPIANGVGTVAMSNI